MSNSKTTQDTAKDWDALQRQYWTAWSDLTRKTATGSGDASTPWKEGVEQWSRMFAEGGKQNDTAERVVESAKSYVTLMQSMLGAASGQNFGTPNAQAWMDTLRSGFNMPGVDPSMLNNPLAKALHDISGHGVQGFEQWAAGAAPMVEQMREQGLSWLRAPAFGYAREHQEHIQKMALALAEFQEANKHYNAQIMKSSKRAFEIFENKLAERSEPGRQIDSMRAFYDLWVDSAEEAYAEIALSDEFRKVYGDVVNAQMRVRSQMQQEVERIGVDLGMPTRTELNSVHKRLHDLRRQLRNGVEAGVDEQIAALRMEVEALKASITRSQRSTAPPPPKKQAQRPKPEASPSKRNGVAFGEAISAMRHQASGKSGTKTSPAKRSTRVKSTKAKTSKIAKAAIGSKTSSKRARGKS